MIGKQLGPYQIVAKLGEGGMGEVYRATDINLKRAVAIKVLPDSVASDAERLARFQREAEVLAALNHPNIAAIYGLETGPALPGLPAPPAFIVMELVEGEDLSTLIARGSVGAATRPQAQRLSPTAHGLPVDEALSIARQIADALEAAHEHGIVHRDLKPANIKIREDGVVKVLDFGLAKAIDSGQAGGAGTAGRAGAEAGVYRPDRPDRPGLTSPTITSPAQMTGVGVILGTAAYMSPEQARGKAVDRRADIWAFGVVLYEMLTGARAFTGEEISDVLAAVLRQDIDWNALPAGTPAGLRRLLARCLDRDPKRRLRDIGEARVLIDEVLAGTQENTVAVGITSAAPRWRRALPWVLGALVGAGVSAAILMWRTPAAPVRRLAHFTIATTGAPRIRARSFGASLAIAPDGSRVVYRTEGDLSSAESGHLYLRTIDQTQSISLRGTDGAIGPVFSPDGQWIAYFDERDATLKRISVLGGAPQTICSLDGAQPRGTSWGSDDNIVFATTQSRGLLRVPAAGGKPERLTTGDAVSGEDQLWPDVLPGGRAVLFTVFKGSLTNGRIAVLSLSSGQVTPLLDGTSPHYSPTGHLVFVTADGALRAVAFDARRLMTSGTPIAIVERVGMGTNGSGEFAVAADGSLVYATGSLGVPPRTLVWVDRAGHEEAIPTPPRAYTYARLSPDGMRAALDSRDDQNDIWIWDLARRLLQRLTNDPGLNRSPVWTPDGQRVAFTAERDRVESIYWQAFDGSGTMERLSSGTQIQNPQAFSPDGAQLLFAAPLAPPYDVGVITLATHTTKMLLQSAASEVNAEISPDGRWLAYQSNESTRDEVYVRPFPDVDTGRKQVSTDGGTRPLWSRDGRELFYYVAPDTIMAVPVHASTGRTELPLGNAQPVVKGPYAVPFNAGRHYDVSRDGRRFLLLKDAPAPDGQKQAPPELHLVQNWAEQLKAQTPAK